MTNWTYIDCPRARTPMTPCVARDGRLAVADAGECVGCGADPTLLLVELGDRWPGATVYAVMGPLDADTAAEALTVEVRAYVENQRPDPAESTE
jgi:hypothetical protein